MKKARLILVGNGMAGVRTLEELLKIAPDRYDITVFGAEPHGNYNRILLSPVLAGEMKLPEIMLNDLDWYRQHGITLHSGRKIVRIDRVRRKVVADDGSEEAYDRLLLATGSTPFILPVPGHDLPGVLAYRDIADTEAMIDACAPARRGDRRRPARAGGGQRPQGARHGGHRGASGAVDHGAPARPHRRRHAAGLAGGARPGLPSGEADRRAGEGHEEVRRPRRGRALCRRQRDPRRAGGDGHRHPPQHEARRGSRPALQPRHRRQRHDADLRPAHLRRRRVRRPQRRCLRSRRAAVRAGQGGRQPPRRVRNRPLCRLGGVHQAQGDRHRRLLRRRLHGQRGRPRRSSCTDKKQGRRVQEAGDRERAHRRRRALRRHGRLRLVLPADEGEEVRRPDPRPPDARPVAQRRRRPRGQEPRGGAGR